MLFRIICHERHRMGFCATFLLSWFWFMTLCIKYRHLKFQLAMPLQLESHTTVFGMAMTFVAPILSCDNNKYLNLSHAYSNHVYICMFLYTCTFAHKDISSFISNLSDNYFNYIIDLSTLTYFPNICFQTILFSLSLVLLFPYNNSLFAFVANWRRNAKVLRLVNLPLIFYTGYAFLLPVHHGHQDHIFDMSSW